ncbi:MAG: hypothetical protein RLZZ66_519 [Pseudomonadota bacterium]
MSFFLHRLSHIFLCRFSYNVSFYPTFDTEGVVNGNTTIRFKVTKAQQSVLTQKLKAQQYDSLISGIAGFWHLDEMGDFIEINDQYCQASGYTRESLIYKSISELETVGNEGEFMEIFNSLQIEQPQYFETKHKRQDGSTWDIRIMLSRQQDQSVHVFSWDISARKKEEEEKKFLLNQLYHLQKMESVGRLTSGIAHDFNNLLMAITGYNEFNKFSAEGIDSGNPKLSELKAEIIANSTQIDVACSKSAQLIEKMLVYCRRNVENYVHNPVLDLNAVLRENLQMLRSIIPSTIQFEVDLAEQNFDLSKLDETNLNQMMVNLFMNARDAIQSKGVITLKTHVVEIVDFCSCCQVEINGRFVEMSVGDNGRGIEANSIRPIFEPFYTTKRVEEGTGLGLSLVVGILHNMRGFILLDTEVGVGSTFRLLFPFYELSSEKMNL